MDADEHVEMVCTLSREHVKEESRWSTHGEMVLRIHKLWRKNDQIIIC